MSRDHLNYSSHGFGFEAKMGCQNPGQGNETLRQMDTVFEQLFKYFTVLTVLGVAVATIRIRETGWLFSYSVQWAIALGMVLIVLIRRKTPFQIRMVTLCVFGLIYGGIGTFTHGILGQGPLIMLFVCVIATLGGRTLHGYVVAYTSTILIIIAGIAFYRGWLTVSVNPASYVVSIGPWATASVTVLILSIYAAMFLGKIKELWFDNIKRVELSEAKFRLLAENATDNIWTFDLNTMLFTYTSPSVQKIRGYTPQEAIKLPLDKTLSPESLEKVLKILQEELSQEGKEDVDPKRSRTVETQALRKDGNYVWIESTMNFIRDTQGRPFQVMGVTRDITERKQAEKEQKKLQAQLSNSVEMAQLGPWEYDVANDLFTLNDYFYKIFRTTAEQIGGYTMSLADFERRFVHPDDLSIVREEIRKAIGATDSNFSQQIEHRILYADGTVGHITVRFFIVKDAVGQTVKTHGVIQDISEQKQAEDRLRESEEKLARSKKMESLGLLAGGVAHDLNNVLAGIVSYPELLLLELPEDSKFRNPIQTIQESGNRAVAIVQDLLTMARGAASPKETLNLNDIVRGYLSSPEFNKLEQFHPTITVKTDLDKDLLNISGSLVHIRKAIMNLVSNSSEAIEGTGNVIISTINRYVDKPLRRYEDVNIGEYAVLTVSDDGSGILSDYLEKIFEPFFTKKVMGRSGTGLGLAVVWNIVQDHKGYINVESDENGTTFELYFPITRDEVTVKDLPISIEEYKGDGETILVVDDIGSQREISCNMLEALGYKPGAVASGEEAVKYLKKHTVDLILLDMIMDPGINGRETYERIIEIHPTQKAIIVSGFAETDEVKEIQKLGAGQYIRKPLTLERIGPAIKKELEKH